MGRWLLCKAGWTAAAFAQDAGVPVDHSDLHAVLAERTAQPERTGRAKFEGVKRHMARGTSREPHMAAGERDMWGGAALGGE